MKITCMCGYEKERDDCKVIQISPQEKAVLLKQDPDVQDEYYYCPPCYRILQDPEHGPKFIKGLVENKLRSSGVPNLKAKELADKYHQGLIELQRKSKHGTQA